MTASHDWFTEKYMNYGTGFSLQIRACLHEEQTPICKIGIYETTHFGNMMTIDDVIMLTSRDNFFYHEMLAHPVLFSHAAPKDVVIIGGGDCGTLKEVLKHPIHSVTQIEIEEKVTRLSYEYFPELCSSNQDPRASFVFDDGIQWMKDAKAESADIIIVDSTDPVGPAEGLFNVAFYRECFRVLRKDGILVHQSESPLLHQDLLCNIRKAMRSAGFQTCLTLPFPQTVYPSGWHSVTLASKQQAPFSIRKDHTLLNQLDLQYYHFALHEGALTPIPMLAKLFEKEGA
jgi:spermidine synthase